MSCVVFSPCGEKLASGSGAQQVRQKREDKSARIWELSSGHCLMTLVRLAIDALSLVAGGSSSQVLSGLGTCHLTRGPLFTEGGSVRCLGIRKAPVCRERDGHPLQYPA